MAAIYEFQVTGQVGSVVRAALPEMESFEEASGRILRGTAAERRQIGNVFRSEGGDGGGHAATLVSEAFQSSWPDLFRPSTS